LAAAMDGASVRAKTGPKSPSMIELQTFPPQPVAVIRTQAHPSERSEAVPRLCGEVFAFAREAGLDPGRMFALYREGTCDLEVGVEVSGPFSGTDRVAASTLPAGEVATTVHLGDYDRLGEPHRAIRAFCAERGLALAGPFWELYGHGEADPAKRRTDVFYLLRSEVAAG